MTATSTTPSTPTKWNKKYMMGGAAALVGLAVIAGVAFSGSDDDKKADASATPTNSVALAADTNKAVMPVKIVSDPAIAAILTPIVTPAQPEPVITTVDPVPMPPITVVTPPATTKAAFSAKAAARSSEERLDAILGGLKQADWETLMTNNVSVKFDESLANLNVGFWDRSVSGVFKPDAGVTLNPAMTDKNHRALLESFAAQIRKSGVPQATLMGRARTEPTGRGMNSIVVPAWVPAAKFDGGSFSKTLERNPSLRP